MHKPAVLLYRHCQLGGINAISCCKLMFTKPALVLLEMGVCIWVVAKWLLTGEPCAIVLWFVLDVWSWRVVITVIVIVICLHSVGHLRGYIDSQIRRVALLKGGGSK